MFGRRSFLSILALFGVVAGSYVMAQERYFVSPGRGGVEAARQSFQLQQETNRGITHHVSITALEVTVDRHGQAIVSNTNLLSTLQGRAADTDVKFTIIGGELTSTTEALGHVKPHAKAAMPGTCSQTGAKLRFNTTSNAWECVAEGDPTVQDFAKNALPVCGSNQLLRSNGSGLTCVTAGSDYVAAELDPKVGATVNNQFCRGSGSQVVCDQNRPLYTEDDPQVGQLNAGKWCRSDGTSIICDRETPKQGKEESGVIVGCHSSSEWCANTAGAPPDTRVYDTHGGKAWDVPIGPRSFCALGFVAFGTNNAGIQSTGDFCRVLPVRVDDATGKPFWHIRVGSTRNMNVACHAMCID